MRNQLDIWVASILIIFSFSVMAQNSCPDPDRYGIQCIGLCGTTGSTCSYTETFATSFTGNGKYVSISAYANGSLVHMQCLGPFPSSTTQYSITFNAPCDANIYVVYSAYTNSSAQNPCGGTICESGFCAYDTCQEGIYLPITLESFVAEQSDQDIHISWTTLSEINNDHFEIEKSYDGIQWQFFIRQDPLGRTLGRQEYNVRDKNPYEGDNFYRLTQVDLDGSRNHHGIVIVKNYGQLIGFNSQEKTLQYSSIAKAELRVNLIDVTGQVINQMSFAPGETKIIGSNVPAGIYILQYSTATTLNSRLITLGN